MGSNDREVRPQRRYLKAIQRKVDIIPQIDHLPRIRLRKDGLLPLARTLAHLSGDQAHEMARAAAEQAANDDSGTV